MRPGVDPENLVGKRLPNLVDAREVEDHFLEPVEPREDSLRLGTRNEVFPSVTRELQGDVGFREVIVVGFQVGEAVGRAERGRS